MDFDASVAKCLQPGEHLVFKDYPGLRLKVTKGTTNVPRRAWIYRFKSPIDGQMRQIKIGNWPAISAPSAVAKWETLREQRDKKRDPALEKRASRREEKLILDRERRAKREEAYTVRRLCNDYFEGYIKITRKSKGAKQVKDIFDAMLDPLADEPAARITRAQAFNLINSYKHIPVQAKKLRAELGAAWQHALDASKIPENTPNWWREVLQRSKILRSKGKKIAGVSQGKTERSLSPEEVSSLLPWLPNFSRNVADVITLYLWTGTRGSEIVSMERKEISEEKDGLWWTIPKHKTKNVHIDRAGDLRVPLIGRAEKIVKRRLAAIQGNFLFPSPKKERQHIEQKAVQTAVHYHQPYSNTRSEDERPRLPVTHWSPHDLRRTARTFLPSLGCDQNLAEIILGHVLPGTKGIYDKYAYDAERRLWLTKLDAHLENLAARN